MRPTSWAWTCAPWRKPCTAQEVCGAIRWPIDETANCSQTQKKCSLSSFVQFFQKMFMFSNFVQNFKICAHSQKVFTDWKMFEIPKNVGVFTKKSRFHFFHKFQNVHVFKFLQNFKKLSRFQNYSQIKKCPNCQKCVQNLKMIAFQKIIHFLRQKKYVQIFHKCLFKLRCCSVFFTYIAR